VGLSIYAFSGTSGYFLGDLYLIILSRMLLGVGISIIMTIAVTLVGDYFEGRERQKFVGQQSAFIGMAGVLFLSVGGFLATRHWRMPFLIYSIALLLVPMVHVFLKESKPTTISSNVVSASPAILKILFPIGTFFMILFYLMPTQLPFLLQSRDIGAPSNAGLALAVNAFGMVCTALLYSRIKQKTSFLVVAWSSLLVMGAGYLLTAVSMSFESILMAVFLAGLGLGLFIANLNFWVLEVSPAMIRGKNMGILTACLFLGQFLSPLIAEPIIRHSNLAILFVSSLIMMSLMGITLTVFDRIGVAGVNR